MENMSNIYFLQKKRDIFNLFAPWRDKPGTIKREERALVPQTLLQPARAQEGRDTVLHGPGPLLRNTQPRIHFPHLSPSVAEAVNTIFRGKKGHFQASPPAPSCSAPRWQFTADAWGLRRSTGSLGVYTGCRLFRGGGKVPAANRTTTTPARRMRLLDPTCLIQGQRPQRDGSQSNPGVQTSILMTTPKSCNGRSCASHALPKMLRKRNLFWQPRGCLPSAPESSKEDGRGRGQSHQETTDGHPMVLALGLQVEAQTQVLSAA